MLMIIFFNSQAMMPTQESKPKDQDKQSRQQRKAIIVKHVVDILSDGSRRMKKARRLA
jgi:hypothetical protein